MVFKIEAAPSLPAGLSLVQRGTQLAYLDVPMTFLLTSTTVPKPFPIRFTLRIDASKKPGELVKGIVTEQGLDITLYNPFKIGPSTLMEPMAVLGLPSERTSLLMQFAVGSLGEVKQFVFHYEFYEQPMSPEANPTTPAAAPA